MGCLQEASPGCGTSLCERPFSEYQLDSSVSAGWPQEQTEQLDQLSCPDPRLFRREVCPVLLLPELFEFRKGVRAGRSIRRACGIRRPVTFHWLVT